MGSSSCPLRSRLRSPAWARTTPLTRPGRLPRALVRRSLDRFDPVIGLATDGDADAQSVLLD
jgi:hypothetical protein